MGRAIDRDDLLPRAGIDVEAVAEALRCLQREFGSIGDGPADVVGQAAVGVAHVSGTLDHDDFGVLIQTAQTGRGGCSSGDAADDDDFHDWVPFGKVHADGGRRGVSLANRRTGPTADAAHVHDIGIPLVLKFEHDLCAVGASPACLVRHTPYGSARSESVTSSPKAPLRGAGIMARFKRIKGACQ